MFEEQSPFERMSLMPAMPDPADPGWDGDLAWPDAPELEEECWDHDDLTAEELAGVRAAAADERLAVEAATTGRRGPGYPGSARVFPGESASRAAGFGTGMALDVTPGCPGLAVAAAAAAGDGDKDCFEGRAPPGFAFTRTSRDGPPGGYGTWALRTPGPGPDLTVTLDSVSTDPCRHRYRAKGHDPGVRLRHLAQIRHATCTSPVCRRPAAASDFEHNTPYEAGGPTCLCNAGPKCRHDHRLKQQPGWKVEQLADGTFRWTTPAGRSYDTEPTRYPI
jgi:hypothetical protein